MADLSPWQPSGQFGWLTRHWPDGTVVCSVTWVEGGPYRWRAYRQGRAQAHDSGTSEDLVAAQVAASQTAYSRD